MTDAGCSDVVRFAGDLGLAPRSLREPLASHLAACPDCATYAAQMSATRELLGQLPKQPAAGDPSPRVTTIPEGNVPTPASGGDPASVRSDLLARALLLDPANAEDLVQRTYEVGLALQGRDARPRAASELIGIMHALSEAQARLDGRSAPATDVTAAARTRAESLEGLDSDADEPELFYPELYPDTDRLDGWAEGPNQWRGASQVLGPEEIDETGEVYDVLDKAMTELPEPLGELLALVDLQGYALAGSAEALGLDQRSATAALARARNHVRGRLEEF